MTTARASTPDARRPTLPEHARLRLSAPLWHRALATLDRGASPRPEPGSDPLAVISDEPDPPVDPALVLAAAKALVEHAVQAARDELRLDPSTVPARLADVLDAAVRAEARDGADGWGADLPSWRHATDLARRAVRDALRDRGIHDRGSRAAVRAARLRFLATRFIEGGGAPHGAGPAEDRNEGRGL
jgi:hypothetical protein